MSDEPARFIPSFVINNPLYKNENLRILLFTIGAFYSAIKVINLWKPIIVKLVKSDQDLLAKYGKNSWALVTGASDGIGKAFCFELARRGFNIVLIARNKEKLEDVEKELKKLYPDVQTKIVVKDFAQAHQENFAEDIYDQVCNLDISILVNNVGQGGGGKYFEMDPNKIRDMVLVNCLSHALITRVLLPKLVARGQKSAIINMSSIVAAFPRPHLQLYGATKVFHDYLSRGLAYEHPELDIISLQPGFVNTSMIRYRGTDMKTITPEEFVKVSLESLGTTEKTYGHWKHKWRGFIGDNVPDMLKKYYIKTLR